MSKIITVWGNPGCGKSMFCCCLAKVLTAGKEKALIINADSSTPMLPVWMPERILETNASIGNVLTGLEINTALVAERVTILKEYPFIGVMGYAAGENPFSYPELKYDKIKLFIGEAAKLVDYIILDCSSNMLNFFTPTAIEAADVTVRIITPDLRGLNYLRAHKPLLTDDKFHYNSHLTFAGLARPFHMRTWCRIPVPAVGSPHAFIPEPVTKDVLWKRSTATIPNAAAASSSVLSTLQKRKL